MFEIVSDKLLRWGTPDPEGDWIMYGHLIFEKDMVLMVDPPLVPGLLDSVARLGKVEAILLTTLDHTRGAKYIAEKTGATLFIPDQVRSTCVNPDRILVEKEISKFQKYGDKTLFGLKPLRITAEGVASAAIPWIDEYALLTGAGQLIVGDIAIGTRDGKIRLAPEWFPHTPPHQRHHPALRQFTKAVRESGATSMLASHGFNVYRTLQRLEFVQPVE